MTVRDSGLGLDPRSMEQVFVAFHTTKPGGLGMGLSISRSIVENHAGRLWATANDGPEPRFSSRSPPIHPRLRRRVSDEPIAGAVINTTGSLRWLTRAVEIRAKEERRAPGRRF